MNRHEKVKFIGWALAVWILCAALFVSVANGLGVL
jgi:hypothetical protein